MKKIYFVLLIYFISIHGDAYGGLFRRTTVAPIKGQVVDMETAKPLENVHVAVLWYKASGFEGNRDTHYIEETVTDEDGFFEVDKWKDKSLFKERRLIRTPTLVFFKPGYRSGCFYDYKGRDARTRNKKDSVEEIYKTGIIKLEKFEGDLIAWEKEISLARSWARLDDYDLKVFSSILSKEREMIYDKRSVTKARQRKVY